MRGRRPRAGAAAAATMAFGLVNCAFHLLLLLFLLLLYLIHSCGKSYVKVKPDRTSVRDHLQDNSNTGFCPEEREGNNLTLLGVGVEGVVAEDIF